MVDEVKGARAKGKKDIEEIIDFKF